MPIRRLVLDVMKPFDPDIIEYATQLEELEGVDGVNIGLLETDRSVENIKITLEGRNIEYETVKKVINDLAGAIHSIDSVATGMRMIEEVHTPQDAES